MGPGWRWVGWCGGTSSSATVAKQPAHGAVRCGNEVQAGGRARAKLVAGSRGGQEEANPKGTAVCKAPPLPYLGCVGVVGAADGDGLVVQQVALAWIRRLAVGSCGGWGSGIGRPQAGAGHGQARAETTGGLLSAARPAAQARIWQTPAPPWRSVVPQRVRRPSAHTTCQPGARARAAAQTLHPPSPTPTAARARRRLTHRTWGPSGT